MFGIRIGYIDINSLVHVGVHYMVDVIFVPLAITPSRHKFIATCHLSKRRNIMVGSRKKAFVLYESSMLKPVLLMRGVYFPPSHHTIAIASIRGYILIRLINLSSRLNIRHQTYFQFLSETYSNTCAMTYLRPNSP